MDNYSEIRVTGTIAKLIAKEKKSTTLKLPDSDTILRGEF